MTWLRYFSCGRGTSNRTKEVVSIHPVEAGAVFRVPA